MKRTKRGMALILSAVMLASCVTTILIAASKDWSNPELGSLSQYYETGTNADPGRISTVKEDSGGTSYGIYMFVEKTVKSFMDWLCEQPSGTTYRAIGDKLYNAYAYNTSGQYYPGFGSNFKNIWQEIGRNNRTEFAQAQKDFWESTQYTQLIANVKSLFPGFDMSNYSIALQNVFWSRSVHHGVGVTSGAVKSSDGKSGATGVIYRAFNSLGGFKNQSEAELIAAIYAECSRLDPSGKYKDDNMETLTAKKYGTYGRSMAYFNVNGGGVQTSVYSRLHVNEPADALVMRYQNISTTIPEGRCTLRYFSEQTFGLAADSSLLAGGDKASALTLTCYSGGKYTISTDDGRRLALSNGALTLEKPSTSANQFWIIAVSGGGYTLYNCGAGRYLALEKATSTTPGQPDTTQRDKLIEERYAALDAGTADEAFAEKVDAALSQRLTDLINAAFKDKSGGEVTEMMAANMQKLSTEEQALLAEVLPNLSDDEEELAKQLAELDEATSLAMLKLFTGKTDEELDALAKEIVAELVDEELAAAAPSTTVNTYKITLTDKAADAAIWAQQGLSGKDGWTLSGLFYPGCTDSDAIGGKITHNLTEGNSSFPLRGVISHPKGLKSVTVEVSGNTSTTFSVSANCSGTWFDLWTLDARCTFSKLAQGSYTLTIRATNAVDNKSEVLLSSPFTVGARDSGTTPELSKEEYTVTFVNGSTKTTKVYKLGDTYGQLPSVTGEGFQGWFMDDGTEVFDTSIVAAQDHTITARFGELYTITFVADGTTVKSTRLGSGSLITAPSNPIKAADKNYTYSFSYWVDEAGKIFTAGATYVDKGNITYTAVFSKTANSGGGGTGGGGTGGGGGGGTTPVTPSGSYLTGISPNTSVSSLTASGYTVYNGSKQVTSGLVGTGMTAVSSGGSVTIVVTGDVSGDGKVTITDVVKLQKSVVGSASLTGAYAKAGDISGDGKITITDVVQAAQVTVGQRTIN